MVARRDSVNCSNAAAAAGVHDHAQHGAPQVVSNNVVRIEWDRANGTELAVVEPLVQARRAERMPAALERASCIKVPSAEAAHKEPIQVFARDDNGRCHLKI